MILTSDIGPIIFNSEVKFAFIGTSIDNKNNQLGVNTNNLLTFLIENQIDSKQE